MASHCSLGLACFSSLALPRCPPCTALLTIRGTRRDFPAIDRAVIREIIFAAVIAGTVAALPFTLVQSVWIIPLIVEAEAYEDAAKLAEAHQTLSPSAVEHHHDPVAWKPQSGWERSALTFAANVLAGAGYGFVLMGSYLLWREPKSVLWGAAYGAGGFCAFFVAPALGLSPELPGTPTAELIARQEWWLMMAAATVTGVVLFCSRNTLSARALAMAILLAPHFIPAPHLAIESSLALADLQSRLRSATTIANGVFWLSLGLASAAAFRNLRSRQP